MKKISTLLLLLFIPLYVLFSQTVVNFAYDNSGNRIYRGIIKIESKKSGHITDTTSFSGESQEQKVLEENQGKLQIKIYPNPTRGQIRVEILGLDPSKTSSMKLYNLKGLVVAAKANLTGNDIVDLSGSPVGAYVLKIQIEDNVFEWKILKE